MIKNSLLLFVLLLCSAAFAQLTDGFLPLQKMNAEEKAMYQLLKKSVLKQSKDSTQVHFFPIYQIKEWKDQFKKDVNYLYFTTLIYDEPNYSECSYAVYSCCYQVSLSFTKQKEIIDYEHGSSGSPGVPGKPTKITYTLKVQDAFDDSANYSFKASQPILSYTSDKPFFENKYSKVVFIKGSWHNAVDKSYFDIPDLSARFINKEYAIVERNNLFGIVNKKNKALIPFEYQTLQQTRFGLLAKKDEQFMFIDFNQKPLSKSYDKIDYYFGCYTPSLSNYLKVEKNGLFNLIDTNFNEKFPEPYNKLTLLMANKEYSAQIIASKNDKQLLIDAATLTETTLVYDEIKNIDNSTLQIKEAGKYGLIKRDGTTVLTTQYDGIELLTDTYPKMIYKLTLLDTYCLYRPEPYFFFTNFIYDSIDFAGGVFVARKEDKWGLVDRDGFEITSFIYDKIEFVKAANNFDAVKDGKVVKLNLKGVQLN